jgi:hypothetical protein
MHAGNRNSWHLSHAQIRQSQQGDGGHYRAQAGDYLAENVHDFSPCLETAPVAISW